jgi:hypothetical protein
MKGGYQEVGSWVQAVGRDPLDKGRCIYSGVHGQHHHREQKKWGPFATAKNRYANGELGQRARLHSRDQQAKKQ